MSDDVLVDVKNLVLNSWNPSNTGGRTPTVKDIAEVKRTNLRTGDFIFIWELIYLPEDNASGGESKQTITNIMLDIRTAESRAQFVSMRKELRRVLNNAQIDVFSDLEYDISDIMEDTDMSSKMVGLWRSQMKWRLEQFNLLV